MIRRFFIIFSLFAICQNVSFADSFPKGSLNWKPVTAESVSQRANKAAPVYSPIGGAFQDPMVNSMVNGYANMMQGATGGSYNAAEQQKIQADFAKQQMNYSEGEE